MKDTKKWFEEPKKNKYGDKKNMPIKPVFVSPEINGAIILLPRGKNERV